MNSKCVRALKFHETHHINSKSFKNISKWHGKKLEKFKNCPICFLYNQIPLPVVSNHKTEKRN